MTAELIILGSSNAIPTLEHDTAHFALRAGSRTILVDCGANPIIRLEQAGIDVHAITDIILTHFHPDHVGGVPLMLMDLWLMGRRNTLNIYGLDYTLDRVGKMMSLYDWAEWPGFFQINFYRLPEEELAVLMDVPEVRISCSPVKHLLPNIGLRFELKAEKKSLAYSCDTEFCPAVIELARDVDILLHEASGRYRGHSTAAQAGKAAQEAGAKSLYLIHYPTGRYASGDLLAEAGEHFRGEITLARDFTRVDLS